MNRIALPAGFPDAMKTLNGLPDGLSDIFLAL